VGGGWRPARALLAEVPAQLPGCLRLGRTTRQMPDMVATQTRPRGDMGRVRAAGLELTAPKPSLADRKQDVEGYCEKSQCAADVANVRTFGADVSRVYA
jgi:hypothetical protein